MELGRLASTFKRIEKTMPSKKDVYKGLETYGMTWDDVETIEDFRAKIAAAKNLPQEWQKEK